MKEQTHTISIVVHLNVEFNVVNTCPFVKTCAYVWPCPHLIVEGTASITVE